MTTITITVERDIIETDEETGEETVTGSEEIEVEVTGSVSRCRPATRWDPAEGGDVEIEEVDGRTSNGDSIELTAEEEARAEEALGEAAAEEYEGEDPDDARDRQMDREYDRAHGYDD